MPRPLDMSHWSFTAINTLRQSRLNNKNSCLNHYNSCSIKAGPLRTSNKGDSIRVLSKSWLRVRMELAKGGMHEIVILVNLRHCFSKFKAMILYKNKSNDLRFQSYLAL